MNGEGLRMDQKKLSASLKAIIIGVGICGLIVYFAVLPIVGLNIAGAYPDAAGAFWPWLIFLWLTAVPCYAVLFMGWKIAANIGLDRSFCTQNALLLKRVADLAAWDTLFFFLGNLTLLLLDMNHPSVLLLSLLVCFAGAAVTVAAVCLSHLVLKAAELQAESDLTV